MAYTEWADADLPLDIEDGVLARLPLPSDRARSATRQLASNLPWIVLPSGAFCTAGIEAVLSQNASLPKKALDYGEGAFFHRIPGLPENATCLGATDTWLALDVTDDVFRRTPFWDHYCPDTGTFINDKPRADVKHKHAYLLYNPFSKVTVPLPELDAIIGHVAETFEVRKVFMRSPSTPDDVIAVTTNNWNYNVILCRPGMGTFVLDDYRVIDVAFLGDVLYGITLGEELLAFHLSEDEDGSPTVIRIELVIKNSLARYYYDEFSWTWPEDVVDTSDEGVGQDDHENVSSGDEEVEEPHHNDNEDQEEHDISGEGQEADGNELDDEHDVTEEGHEADVNEELDDDGGGDSFNGDGMVSDNDVFVGHDEEVTYEPKDVMFLDRYLVRSRSGGLILVRRQHQSAPYSNSYTRKVDIFKADLSEGKWVPSNGLGKGEALFLSRSFSKCTRACGEIKEGFMYYTMHLDDVFDTTAGTTHRMVVRWPWQCRRESSNLLTWLFPPELVVSEAPRTTYI